MDSALHRPHLVRGRRTFENRFGGFLQLDDRRRNFTVTVTAPLALPASVRMRRINLRTTVLPLAASVFLLAGGVCWLWSYFGDHPGYRELAHSIWLGGLLLTGLPVVARELGQIFRGRWATDLIATLAIGGSVGLNEPLAGLVIVIMQTGHAANGS